MLRGSKLLLHLEIVGVERIVVEALGSAHLLQLLHQELDLSLALAARALGLGHLLLERLGFGQDVGDQAATHDLGLLGERSERLLLELLDERLLL